ncbi:phosphoribosylamine--glycine ligase [Alkaliphilus hydrothermalis]|uniref:Phosphoribosylamine--glycine ligase n=1 Tax=Alkaliphilus hydrothermalis TaxID=1482730 RepID=A0ABS2NSU7_9FIRM|nr:phosphoribosylamine--glycine ligase [Alkaliphilus hydrothermalis]MBM7616018.1 phosphoribosylamine--glycine ligase [Alkaliphilus hydrothermalis]
MKVLVIGGGGREHAIVWKLKQSSLVSDLYCAPGNPGIGKLAKCVNIKAEDIAGLVEFSREMKIDMTIVGPEVPLVMGIVDEFNQAGLKIIGPSRKAAELEGSKAFSKEFMEKYNIPTAKFHRVYSFEAGVQALEDYSYPVVIKADGLAAGKGVLICSTAEEAEKGLREILVEQVFGDAGKEVVIEEFLEGIETSVLCFVDGKTIVPMVGSQDHKRVYDGDKGPNTGGMGTYSPNYAYTDVIAQQVMVQVLEPTLKGIQGEEMDYHGILFVGLMITQDGPKVLEYNVRFGDPETQVVLARLESDLAEIFQYILREELDKIAIQWSSKAAVCVVLASEGYPDKYEKGKIIKGLKKIETDIVVFHAGTILREGEIVTSGGRVLGVTAIGDTIEEARSKAYDNIKEIHFDGMIYRRDIAVK